MRSLLLLVVPVFVLTACRSNPLAVSTDLGVAGGPATDGAAPFDAAADNDGALFASCAGLDEGSCRAHPECITDYCEVCSCVPTFVGCRAPTAPKTGCPAVGCEQAACCRSQMDCGFTNTYCARPDDPNSGVSTEFTCTDSVQCAIGSSCRNSACDPTPCSLLCSSGLVCDVDPTAGAACVHQACTTDGDCERGFCVLGACYRSLGTCLTPGE